MTTTAIPCPSCEGHPTRVVVEEWDEFGPLPCMVTCEGCDGCGLLDTCKACLDRRPLSELEMNPGRLCGDCAAEAVQRDERSFERQHGPEAA